MKNLYFDTETTGTLKRHGNTAENAPHIVQLAASLRDDEGNVLSSINVIIRPDGWTIPDEAAAIHGITQAMAEEYGIPLVVALACFSQMVRNADQLVAHNLAFDRDVIGYNLERLGKPNTMTGKPTFCTMLKSVRICRIPPFQYGDWKWPKLMQAYVHFFGKEFDSAHDALADVNACAEVHQAILRHDINELALSQ
jgi:DNA polymerase-3 subunit epsilon